MRRDELRPDHRPRGIPQARGICLLPRDHAQPPAAIEVIRRIREIGDAVLVTARTGERLSFAEEWLSLHEETRGMRIIGLNTKATSKLSRCVEEGISVLIDDDERHLREASEMGMCAILFKQNSPADLTCDYALICRSWDNILDYLCLAPS